LRRCAIGCNGGTPEQGVLSANARRGSTFFLFQNWFFGVVTPTQQIARQSCAETATWQIMNIIKGGHNSRPH